MAMGELKMVAFTARKPCKPSLWMKVGIPSFHVSPDRKANENGQGPNRA